MDGPMIRANKLVSTLCALAILSGLLIVPAFANGIADSQVAGSPSSVPSEAHSESLLSRLLIAADKGASEKSSAEEKTAAAQSSATAAAKAKLEELTLNDIQDTALLLDFIQEQCINVYEEASRVPVSVNSTADFKQIDKIPVQLSGKTFLPPRQEWLVFFVGTVEPVIRQFGTFVKDIDAGKKQVVVPDQMSKTIEPLFDEWEKDTKALNAHLDQLVPLFDDAPNQAEKIRNLAVDCYDDAGRMEAVRRKIFVVLQKNAKQGGDKVLMSPQ